MKKSLLAAFVVAGLFATSCKKERTCTCTSTAGGVSAVAEYTIKDTKKNAEDACDGYEASASAGGATATVSCELD